MLNKIKTIPEQAFEFLKNREYTIKVKRNSDRTYFIFCEELKGCIVEADTWEKIPKLFQHIKEIWLYTWIVQKEKPLKDLKPIDMTQKAWENWYSEYVFALHLPVLLEEILKEINYFNFWLFETETKILSQSEDMDIDKLLKEGYNSNYPIYVIQKHFEREQKNYPTYSLIIYKINDTGLMKSLELKFDIDKPENYEVYEIDIEKTTEKWTKQLNDFFGYFMISKNDLGFFIEEEAKAFNKYLGVSE